MRKAPLTFTMGAALLLAAPPGVNAMGFGRVVTSTTLGQPLNFAAAVFLESDENLPRECVGADVFVGEALLPAPNVRVTLEPSRDGNGRVVRVTTATLIDEPIVTVEVSVGCNSRMSRRFVTFIDPPLVYLAQAQGETLDPQQGADTRVTPILEASRSGARGRLGADDAASKRPSAVAARRAPRDDGRSMADAQVQVEGARPRSRSTRAATPNGATSFARAGNRGAPRLQLEAPSLLTATTPTILAANNTAAAPNAPTTMAPPMPSIVPPPLSPASSAEPALAAAAAAIVTPLVPPANDAERERMQALEAGLARLTAESQANQQSIVTLQARLRQAENDRYANGLVYALAAGMIFFALLAAAFWALRPRQRQRARWFDAANHAQSRAQRKAGTAAEAATSTPSTPAAPTASTTQPLPAAEPAPVRSRAAALPTTSVSPSTIGGLEVTTVLGPEPLQPVRFAEPALHASNQPAVTPRSGAMTMEELIDLEQQAEFFVVLGQDEAAIDLLGSHVREEGSVSPLPFLKLLEIYQRRGDQLAYERVRESFKARFDAAAPEWTADLQAGRSLADYPQTIARLQAQWTTPMQAMQALDGLLFGRGEADESFDFPAYRELLFLYSVARELAGNVDTELGPIDLFLPLDDGSSAPAEPVRGALDLDIASLQPGAGEEFVIRRSPGRRGAA